MLDKPRDRRMHPEYLLLIVPASIFACLGSALFSAVWNDPYAHNFSDKAADLGALILGGSVGLIGFGAILLAIIGAVVPFNDRVGGGW